MTDKTLVEPSNDEQSQWPEATEAYVRDLEEINEAQATRIEALERLVYHYIDVSDVRQDDEAFLLEIVRRLPNEQSVGQPWLRTYDAHLKGSNQAMTIEQKAREIAERVEEEHGSYWGLPEAARLGIIEGLEMAAKVADRHTYPSALVTSEGKAKDIAKAIRALIEEQKV